MATEAVFDGGYYAGCAHIRFDEGTSVLEKSRWSILCHVKKLTVTALAAFFALTGVADIKFGKKWYEALADAEGVTCVGWRDFYMGANVAIPVTVTDGDGRNVVLRPNDITISPGTYIDYGTPYILTESKMWETYGKPLFDQRNNGRRIDLEKDGGVWVYNNWDWEDIVGFTYELEKEIWPFFDDKSSTDDDVANWLAENSSRQWILIPTGTRPQKGTHTFKVQVSAGGSTGVFPISFTMTPDQKATAATVRFNANGGKVDEYGRVVKLNSAIGDLPVPEERIGFTFGGWWTAKAKGIRISASTKVKNSMVVYARWMTKKYKVSAAVSAKTAGAVSGAGTKAYGSKVTLRAASKKGYVFVKWVDLDNEETPWPSVVKCRQPSVSFTMGAGAVSVRAVFAKASEDVAPVLAVDSAEDWYVELEPSREIAVATESLSYPTVTVKGQPAGIGLVRVPETDSKYVLKVTDASKVKPGVYTAKITAKNRAGKSAAKSVKIVAPNSSAAIANGLIAGLETSTLSPYAAPGGMKTKWTLADLGVEVFATNGWKLVSVTGLPTGLSWNGSAIVGTASKTGLSTVTFKMQKKVGSGKKAKTYTSTATATFKVDALLPAALVGAYNGFANTNVLAPDEGDEGENGDGEGDDEETYGVYTPIVDGWASAAKVTVTAAGKITASICGVALSGAGFDSESNGVYAVTLKKTQKITKGSLKGKSRVWEAYFEIDTNAAWDARQLVGWYQSYTTGLSGMMAPAWITAQRNPFALDDAKAVAAAIVASGNKGARGFVVSKAYGEDGARTLDCAEYVVGGKATVTATVKANGTVTLAGKIDKKTVGGTATLEVSGVTFKEVVVDNNLPPVADSEAQLLRCSDGCEETMWVECRTATACFFSGNFVIKIIYELVTDAEGTIVSASGKVWEK